MCCYKVCLIVTLCLVSAVRGDPTVTDNPECLLDVHCPATEVCVENSCLHPCTLCGNNTDCHILGKTPLCLCKPCFTGNPVVGCTRLCKEECKVDSDCESDKACLEGFCKRPCSQACGEHTECSVKNHHAICTCMSNHTWYNDTSCVAIETPPECHKNSDCRSDQNCQEGRCVDACLDVCGRNAVCRAVNHQSACACAPGYSGDPFLGCKARCYKSGGSDVNKSYVLVQETKTRYQAFEACKSRGMSLVSITSHEEQVAVTNFIGTQSTNLENVWTSGILAPTGVVWARPSSYNSVPYSSWRTSGVSSSAIGTCVYLSEKSGYNWNTWNCADTFGAYICEEICQ